MTAYKKAWFVLLLNALLVLPGFASTQKNESQTFLFKNLPKVALLVKEQYVDPQRIKPDAMLPPAISRNCTDKASGTAQQLPSLTSAMPRRAPV